MYTRQHSEACQHVTWTSQAMMMRVLIDFKISEAASSTDDSQMSNAASWTGNWHYVYIFVTIFLGK
jgi:hypothetical protein